jgi:hypothetical protein
MKITKRQLRRIIKEEKAKLAEARHGSPGLKHRGDYAIGAYFDVNMMDQFKKLQHDMFENAMNAAQGDGLEADEAYEEVMAAFETLIEEAQSDMRF